MLPVSSLATVYTAVYGMPPSSHSTAALLAMEQILGLTAEDPLSRMMIVLLHSSDRIDDAAARVEAAQKHDSEHDKQIVGDVKSLVREIQRLRPHLGDMNFLLGRVPHHASPPGWSASVKVDTFRKASPLLSYLRKAFERRNSVDDHDEVVAAARYDLGLVGTLSGIIMLIGMVIGKGV